MSDPIRSLLNDIVAVGDRLRTAITTRQMDAIERCLDERSQLLVELEQFEDVLADHPRWDTVREELAHQHEQIQNAFDEYRDNVESELDGLSGYRRAQSAYGEPTRGSRQILSPNVRG